MQHSVVLDRDHPGFSDPAYRARRDAIARLARAWEPGAPAPIAPYTADEHRVWQTVSRALAPLHRELACDAYKEARARCALREDRIPQLASLEVPFAFAPVAGLVPPRAFLSSLAGGVFLSTQYIRHASAPLYTPEPDVVHELIGHAVWFMDPRMCALQRAFGQAARGASEEAILALDRLYWFTVEFGVVRERGALKAFGAGILSSAGELARFRSADIRPFDPEIVARTPYDPTRFQRTLFAFDPEELARLLQKRPTEKLSAPKSS